MDIVRRALLGDKKAQGELTTKGELLPCPFCGNEKNIISNWGLWRVWCPVCLGKAEDTLTRKDAIIAKYSGTSESNVYQGIYYDYSGKRKKMKFVRFDVNDRT